MKFIITLFLFFNFLVAKDLKPIYTLKSKGSVTEILYNGNKLYASNDKGSVDIFDLTKKEIIKEIELPTIKDFMGDEIKAKIYSIDFLNDKILIVSQGKKGFRNLFIYQNDKLLPIIRDTQGYFIRKAKFINSNQILLGLLSNEIVLYDIKAKKEIYRIQIDQSHFSDFVLSEDKKTIASADESGAVTISNVENGKREKVYKSENVDNVYQIDFKNGIIITAGQDRRVAIYNLKNNSSYHLQSSFLVYSVGLSPSGKIGGYSANEENDVIIFDTNFKNRLYTLKGQKSTLTKILFINEKEIFTSSEDNNINFWRLK